MHNQRFNTQKHLTYSDFPFKNLRGIIYYEIFEIELCINQKHLLYTSLRISVNFELSFYNYPTFFLFRSNLEHSLIVFRLN